MKKLLLIIPILALLLSFNYCLGAGSETVVKVSNPLPWKTFAEFIFKIIEAITLVAIILAPVMILIAGFLMTTSGGPIITGGQQEQIKKAKAIIQYTVIGLLILFGAYGFTYWIYQKFSIVK
jgi:hypothetical protein